MYNKEEKVNITMASTNNYGSTDGSNKLNSIVSPKKMIYCVHGKPSDGCCRVLEGEVIDVEPITENISSFTRENSSTTDLINKHCHKSGAPEIDKNARKKLIIASILCVIFMIAEIVGGYLSNSLAIASDAAHLLTDFASFMISLFSLYMANRPKTKQMSFGWYRAEVIGAMTSVLLIWVVTGILVYMAVQRIIYKEFEIDAFIMLITSGVGVVVNIIMGCSLHQHGHSHDKTNTKGQNINVRAAFIHVLGDFLQSFGVFVAAIVIYFKPQWGIVDPIMTFLFSVFVLITTFAIIKDTLLVLMEALPKGIHFEDVMNILLNIEGVLKVHNLRIWALSLDKITMSAHIAISPGTNPQNVLVVATKNIHEKFNFFEMTLQIEEFENIMDNCKQCQNP
ncbi:zinc transporter 2-like isoform X2 [Sitophilus oryzae]|uniref:Zinc transporter 2-like isoform X2 n=1 Tax=Sitophilus oryzae TaxID=7048 RepID=A0A6J2XBT2_SITOR|nr:zinc transporter 2-like isoform X2 [Sitophilus oryzae]XP_030748416.1 zinc transporter 2-like isoform X2 [Sitophilus oryzae]